MRWALRSVWGKEDGDMVLFQGFERRQHSVFEVVKETVIVD